ncbi:hypothetical protein F5148DRAFT_732472 [Russula earlei]|uniref:Uncharacterized protein n=1 Tax=Russula earlei TaxID=71964 RepID=A0ACC0UN55_9AGAM|nr:hypothetical protein F5148DRAFT_732472 [Russula earlei]
MGISKRPLDATSSPMWSHLHLRRGGPSKGKWKASLRRVLVVRCQDRVPVTISMLPDDVLMDIFYFYVNSNVWRIATRGWHGLVHVCQRWRDIVFASPRRLNLQLEYTGRRPMSEILDVWPVLPVVISLTMYPSSKSYLDSCLRNIAATFESEHHNHICKIDLPRIPISHWERLAAAMQKLFPELTCLHMWVEEHTVTSLPDSFLGGSAPLLRRFSLGKCSFPGMLRLLLSSNHLVFLSLWDIPHSGYFSPQALVTTLSSMSRLETLRLQFKSPQYPTSPSQPPLTRSVLPALTRLVFQGVHEYLEDLLAQIEIPFLNKLVIIFFMSLDFVVPELHQLTRHAERFKTCNLAIVHTSYRAIKFEIFKGTQESPECSLEVRCKDSSSSATFVHHTG